MYFHFLSCCGEAPTSEPAPVWAADERAVEQAWEHTRPVQRVGHHAKRGDHRHPRLRQEDLTEVRVRIEGLDVQLDTDRPQVVGDDFPETRNGGIVVPYGCEQSATRRCVANAVTVPVVARLRHLSLRGFEVTAPAGRLVRVVVEEQVVEERVGRDVTGDPASATAVGRSPQGLLVDCQVDGLSHVDVVEGRDRDVEADVAHHVPDVGEQPLLERGIGAVTPTCSVVGTSCPSAKSRRPWSTFAAALSAGALEGQHDAIDVRRPQGIVPPSRIPHQCYALVDHVARGQTLLRRGAREVEAARAAIMYGPDDTGTRPISLWPTSVPDGTGAVIGNENRSARSPTRSATMDYERTVVRRLESRDGVCLSALKLPRALDHEHEVRLGPRTQDAARTRSRERCPEP